VSPADTNRKNTFTMKPTDPWKGIEAMTGIQYVTDEKGERVAVQLDLRIHADLWQEIEDVLVSESRRDEESIPLERVEAKRLQRGPLSMQLY